MLQRIVDDAFRLGRGRAACRERRPRSTRSSATARTASTPRIAASRRRVTRASSELDGTLAALRSAEKHPGARAAIVEIRAQLAQLFPADLLAWVPLGHLEHFPRYLRAAQTRLGRAIADPRKDAEKLAPIVPLWAAFLAKQASARDRESAQALRWAFEELRVAVFAPELKTPAPTSMARLKTAVADLL